MNAAGLEQEDESCCENLDKTLPDTSGATEDERALNGKRAKCKRAAEELGDSTVI